jgi:hypothetical protein
MKSLGPWFVLLLMVLAMSAPAALGPEVAPQAACADCAADACPDCNQCAGCASFPVQSPAVFLSERLMEGALSDAPWTMPSDEPVRLPGLPDIFHPPRVC